MHAMTFVCAKHLLNKETAKPIKSSFENIGISGIFYFQIILLNSSGVIKIIFTIRCR